MKWFSATRLKKMRSTANTVDRLNHALSFYVMPVAIGLVSLFVSFALRDTVPAGHPTTLSFRILADASQQYDQAQALAALATRPALQEFETRRSEVPHWMLFQASAAKNDQPTDIELPSRHVRDMVCWDAATRTYLGSLTRTSVSGAMRKNKSAYALELGLPAAPTDILCRGKYSGPAHITVMQWPSDDLDLSNQTFHRRTGALEGGLLTLAFFVLMTGVINRQWIYVLFAAWLVGNLRMGAISMGWDTHWLGQPIPADWVDLVRKMTVPVYCILTYSLFGQLFKDDLRRIGYLWLLRAIQWSAPILLVLSAIMPIASYLPTMWTFTGAGIVGLVFLLGNLLAKTPSRVAWWYSASLAIVLFGGFSEVVGAALGIKGAMVALNSVTAALWSSILAAFAIAEQIRAERVERLQAQAELRGTYEVTPVGLFTLDANGHFARVNPAMQRILGVEPGPQQRWGDFFEDGAWPRLRATAVAPVGAEMEIQDRPTDGRAPRRYLIKATIANARIEGSMQDITERSRATEQLRFLSENDPLTGILNRRGIEKVLAQELDTPGQRRHAALAYLDLDRFKLINDLFGHQAGDEVLKQVCDRTRQILGPVHDIGRVGGDEFIIVFSHTDIETATALCRAVVDGLRATPYRVGDRAFQVKGSMGLVEMTADMRPQDAISAADRACREAKRGLHDHLVVYERDASALRERIEELRLIEELGGATPFKGLYLEYQPIMSLQAPDETLNFEVLLRMEGPNNTIIPAGTLIPAAEQHGHIAAIDKWVLGTTLAWLAAHHEQLPKTRFVCVNLSGASLNDERFIADIFTMLSEFDKHIVGLLCIEITESVALHDLENTRRFIDGIKGLGAKIALDDFGAGYTSFSYLKDLSADAIKIDGAFIKSMTSHPATVAIVEAIVELAHNLGMKSIAEWVEDYATLEQLASLGVDYVQGYLLAMPQHPDRILEASSAASFITDEQTRLFVHNVRTDRRILEIWDRYQDLPPSRLQ